MEVVVELPQPGRRSANVGYPENQCAITLEVISPDIFPWIEQPDGQVGVRIETEEVGAFV